jgi:hypothetical protein
MFVKRSLLASRLGSPKGTTWMKVFVLGLDGATWDILAPLAEAGDLPNLAR